MLTVVCFQRKWGSGAYGRVRGGLVPDFREAHALLSAPIDPSLKTPVGASVWGGRGRTPTGHAIAQRVFRDLKLPLSRPGVPFGQPVPTWPGP